MGVTCKWEESFVFTWCFPSAEPTRKVLFRSSALWSSCTSEDRRAASPQLRSAVCSLASGRIHMVVSKPRVDGGVFCLSVKWWVDKLICDYYCAVLTVCLLMTQEYSDGRSFDGLHWFNATGISGAIFYLCQHEYNLTEAQWEGRPSCEFYI